MRPSGGKLSNWVPAVIVQHQHDIDVGIEHYIYVIHVMSCRTHFCFFSSSDRKGGLYTVYVYVHTFPETIIVTGLSR